MDEAYPVEEGIFILKKGRKLGPFEVEELLDGLEEGEFSYDDICLRDGATECERLKDVLDWEKSVSSRSSRSRPGKLIGPNPTPALNEVETGDAPGDGETILYAGHPSIMSSPLALIALVIGVTGGIWLFPIDPSFTAAGIGISLLGLARLSFMRFTQDYLIMPRRIEMITGLIARSSKEVRIEDIRAINVSCRGLIGMLGVGTVDFITTGDSPEVSFRQIWAAAKVKTLIRRLLDSN